MSTRVVPAVVYRARRVGLANRLRALVGYKALAELLGCRFYLCWENDPHCPANFDELFVVDGFELISSERVQLERAAGAIVEDSSDWFTKIGERHDHGGASRDRFWRLSIDNLRSLALRPELAQAVDTFVRANDLTRRTGMHVRYTDNRAAYESWSNRVPGFEPGYVSRLEGFEEYVAREVDASPSARVFLATDIPDVERRFRKRFGDRIISYPKPYRSAFSRWLARMREGGTVRTTPMSHAVIEFYLLAHCRKLIGTYFSSFAELACLIRGAELYEVIGTEVREARTGTKFRYLYPTDWNPGAATGA